MTINFDFLDTNKKYVVTFYEDTEVTHFLDNKEAYRVKEAIAIEKGSKVKIDLAPGGGHSMWIRPVK